MLVLMYHVKDITEHEPVQTADQGKVSGGTRGSDWTEYAGKVTSYGFVRSSAEM